MTARLIVNADDFGIAGGVNRGVRDGHLHGIVTSATLMATGAAFDDAVATAAVCPGLGVGVHLNLTDGSPCSGPASVPSLVGPDGRFSHSAAALPWAIATGRARLFEIECELRAQIERVLGAGIRPTHVDGHKHLHLWPPLLRIVATLAVEYGIRGIRCAPERFPDSRIHLSSPMGQRFSSLALSALALRGRRIIEAAGLRAPDRVVGIAATGSATPKTIERLLGSIGPGTTELVCHPGYDDGSLDGVRTRLRRARELELEALTGVRARETVTGRDLALITYKEIP